MAKIIIIGAGISGLSTYLFLRKHLVLSNPSASAQQYEIKIYEAYDIHQSHFNAALTNPTTSNHSYEGATANAIPARETDPIFTPQAIGSAIGIARNGLNVLARLDEQQGCQQSETLDVRHSSLIEEMAVHGHPIERWELGTARGFTLGQVDLASPGKAAGKKPTPRKHEQHSSTSSYADRNPCPYHGIMIARQSCWEILRDRVLRESPGVVIHKKVVDVVIGDERALNVVTFEDGSYEEADLVIGADGLRSVLRRAMFRKADAESESDNATTGGRRGTPEGQSHNLSVKAPSNWLQTILAYLPIPLFLLGRTTTPRAIQTDYISPHYEGLVGVGGFVPSSVLQAARHRPGTMTVVFGPNGFFGYGYLTSTSSPESPNPSSNDTTAARDTGTTAATTTASSIPAPGPLAGWWSTCSSPNPFPYSSSSSSSSDSPSPSSGGVLNPHPAINTSTSTSGAIPGNGPIKNRKPIDFDKQLALDALLHRHRKWHNPAIQAILSFVQEDTEREQQRQHQRQHQQSEGQSEDQSHHDDHHHNNSNRNSNSLLTGKALDAAYPTWTTPELPFWSLRGRAVLVGDAAHALQPSSGQGASQALEDAEALALFLRRSLVVASVAATADRMPHPLPHASLTTALRAFETTRMPRVHAIHARSQRMSRMKADMGVLAEWAMYIAIYLGTWFRNANSEGEGGESDERYYRALFDEGPLDEAVE